jgi:membrane-associated PAP2 superfamily phosphatase
MLEFFLSGAISAGYLIIALFFVRFWQSTRDRLFLFFSTAFGLLLVERLVRLAMAVESEWLPTVYLFRLAAYGLILVAIIDKNRRS